MGRYTGPSCKKCRRAKVKLFLKGERCHGAKCAIEKRNFPPGPRALRPPKLSEYGRRLIEKQKVRFLYGVSENQMRIYFSKASGIKGITGHNLLMLFEKRVDNIVFRMNLAKSRKQARQLIRHGLFKLNGKKIDIPSIILKAGDELTFKDDKKSFFEPSIENLKANGHPEWLLFDDKSKTVKLQTDPTRDQIDVNVEEQLIVEYYSK